MKKVHHLLCLELEVIVFTADAAEPFELGLRNAVFAGLGVARGVEQVGVGVSFFVEDASGQFGVIKARLDADGDIKEGN